MGQLVLINQPARVSRMGALPGNYYNPGGAGHEGGGASPPMGPTAVSTNFALNQANSLLTALDSIANPEAPQRMTATGVVLPSSRDKARTLPARMTPEPPYVPPQPQPQQQPPAPQGYDQGGDPGAGGGGGGGGGGAAADAGAGGAAADAPVFLGLTQKQLMIGGAVALGAWFLLRKKHGHGSSAGGVL